MQHKAVEEYEVYDTSNALDRKGVKGIVKGV